MRTERPVDDAVLKPISEDGTARMYRLAFVCVLGLIAGGVAALALYHSRPDAAEVSGVAVERPDAGLEAGAEAVESRAVEDGRTVEGDTLAAGDVAAEGVEDETGRSARGASRHQARVRISAGASTQAGNAARGTRRYARASGRQVAAGGRGVGGHAFGGVKKTGEGVKKTGTVIGKTVGKIGGIFND